jgi:hypothetical protein
MSYAIGTFADIPSIAVLVPPPPRRNFRLVTLGMTALGCGMLVTTLAAATTTATWLALDSFGSAPDIRAATKPIALAEPRHAPAHVLIAIEPSPAATPSTVPPLPAAAPGVVPMPIAAAAEIAPLSSVVPRMASLPPDTATPQVAPLPPVAPEFALAPLGAATPVSVPPPTSKAASGSLDAVTPDAVPLPPRRPAGITESHPAQPAEALAAPAAERSPPTVEPGSDVARPASGETTVERTIASAPATAASTQPDSRSIFQRIFGALSQLSAPSAGGGTAVYDIAAHTVYMPNGERLEAHSGRGRNFDDPHSFSQKNRGVIPPQTYALNPREQPFHGVAALRLNPVGDGDMYGRVGMLAHSYMLGPRGDSMGCVSFKDYDKFLAAYQRGEISRLVVVAHGGAAPSSVALVDRD